MFDHESYMNSVINGLKSASLYHTKDGYEIRPIIEAIESGEMSREDVICSLDSFTLTKHKSLISSAFLRYNALVTRASRNRYNQYVIYFLGDGGSGKTNLAKLFARRRLFDRPNDSYCLASGSHAVECFKGQSTFIFDDFRPSLLPFTDFLNLFDPHNLNEISSARYAPAVVFADLKIITASTNYSPESLYYDLHEKYSLVENYDQIYRRLPILIKFNSDTDRLDVFGYRPFDKRQHRSKIKFDFYYRLGGKCGFPNCYRIFDRVLPDGHHLECVDSDTWIVPNGNDFESCFSALVNHIYEYFHFIPSL